MGAILVARFADLVRYLREREDLSQEKFGAKIGRVTQKSIRDWENGTQPTTRSLKKVANYIGKPLEELQRFLDDDSDVPVEEFLAGISGSPRSLRLQQILEWLPLLQAGEVAIVARQCFELIYRQFSREPEPPLSIAGLVRGVKEVPGVSVERLREISEGDRPTDYELVQLSIVLVKPGGGSWTTHELMEIRDRDFPAQHDYFEETKSNG